MPELKDIQNRSKAFKDFPEIAQAKAILELSDLLNGVISAIKNIKDVKVDNLGEVKLDTQPIVNGLETLNSAVKNTIIAVKDIKGTDLSGIIKLLEKISSKEQKEPDLKELKNISKLLQAVNKSISKIEIPEPKDNSKPIIKAIDDVYEIINTLNENIVKTDFGFDYAKLEKIVKKIRGGGGGPNHVTIDNPTTNPVNVAIISGSSATQYTEDDIAAANPIGTAQNLIAKDTLANEVADGDNVAARGTRKGEVYVKHVDTLPISAASLPLPSGAATSANQQTDALTNTELRASPVVVDTELPAAVVLSDTLTNPTTPLIGSATLGWQATSSQWGRVHAHKFTADSVVPADHLGLVTGGPLFVYNETSFDRLRGNTSGLQNIPGRPSQGIGRVYKTANLSNQTADALLYTVTATKTLYVTSIDIFVFNTSTTNVGVLEVKDGTTAAGTTRYPLLMSAAGVGAVTASSAVSHSAITFAEPLQFTSGVFMDITSGTLTYSVIMVGYEQ